MNQKNSAGPQGAPPPERAEFVAAIRHNIDTIEALFAAGGDPPGVIGTVAGSAGATAFWQRQLDRAVPAFRARAGHSFHEDLPVNQAFGLLLLWQRLRPELQPGEGALIAFVFGEGTRATPLTETENGQKPAITSFAATTSSGKRRYLSTVELALRTFAPVEVYLRRSGFDGIVVKWGDEVQIPTLDLSQIDNRMSEADIVRFVSLSEMDAENAANKDWVGVDENGDVTAFIPRRPLAEMAALADRGLIQRREGKLFGGVNLGSIALSRRLLDVLLAEFKSEVNDAGADRKRRPDLDPQLFTALTIANLEDEAARTAAWQQALAESAAMRELDENLPGVLNRLRGAIERFVAQAGRPMKIVAMDFGDQYWGDIGQHRQMYELYSSLRLPTAEGEIARALAGIGGDKDQNGNLIRGSTLGADVSVRDSVLIDVDIKRGAIRDSVLIGTCCGAIEARQAFDVFSSAVELVLEPRSGGYKVVSLDPVRASTGERITTVFLPEREVLLRVHEETDLRDRKHSYDLPVLDNALSFAEAHRLASSANPDITEARRAELRENVRAKIG